jgi:hypothetical protein
VIQNITFSSQINSSKLVATYLAQEGIEAVRNKRDSNWLANKDWNSELLSNMPSLREPLNRKFTRNVTTTSDGTNKNKIIVEVKVSWQELGKNYSVTAQTELYNWYAQPPQQQQ